MATRYAITTGNWSSTATWSATNNGAGGASVPTTGDTADLNSQAVTLDVLTISPTQIQDVSAGGTGTLTPADTQLYTIGTAANNTIIQSSNAATQGMLVVNGPLTINGTVVNAATSSASQGYTVILNTGPMIINGPATGGGSYAVTNNQASSGIGNSSGTSAAIYVVNAATTFTPALTINGDVKNHGANSPAIFQLTGTIVFVNGVGLNDAAGGSPFYLDTGNPLSNTTLLKLTGNAKNTAAGGYPVAVGLPSISSKCDDAIVDIGGSWQNFDPAQAGGTAVAGTLYNVPGSIMLIRGDVDCTAGYCLNTGQFFDTNDFGNAGLLIILGKIKKDVTLNVANLISRGDAFGTGTTEVANNLFWIVLSPVPANSRVAQAQYVIPLTGFLTITFSPALSSTRIQYFRIAGGDHIGPFPITGGNAGPFQVGIANVGPYRASP